MGNTTLSSVPEDYVMLRTPDTNASMSPGESNHYYTADSGSEEDTLGSILKNRRWQQLYNVRSIHTFAHSRKATDLQNALEAKKSISTDELEDIFDIARRELEL